MPVSRDRLHKLSRIGLISANVLVLLALVVTGVFIRLERGWAKPVFRDPEQAFRHGTIGTELMPLPVAYVLPDLFPEHFQPGGPQGGDWVEAVRLSSRQRSQRKWWAADRVRRQPLSAAVGRAIAGAHSSVLAAPCAIAR